MPEETKITRRQTFAIAAAAPLVAAAPGLTQAAAPMMGPSTAVHHRFKLGAFEVTTVFEGAITIDGPHPIFGQDQEAADVQALAKQNFLPPTRMEIGFTPVVVNTGREVVLFDAGNGVARREVGAGQLRARLADAGFAPEQIDVVVITHMHPDHIVGLTEDGAPAFPNARYVTTAAEYDFWSNPDRMSGGTERVAKLVQEHVVPKADKFSFIGFGDDVVSGVTAIDGSGHTPGHTVYNIESDGQRLVLFADLTNHYVASLQRPEWHVRFDMDKEKAGATRRRILDMIAADRVPSAGYHMPFPAVGYVEKVGDGFRWVPASYQLRV
ncbi:MAG: MBL fold metallo-hydrolase [Pseudomonadota bacterium]